MQQGVPTAVVSMPCWELFDRSDQLSPRGPRQGQLRIAIEAGSTFGWERYLGQTAPFVGMKGFGASAPAR